MTPRTVPDFFQEETEEALREQANWLVREVGVDDVFFARLLRLDPNTVVEWRSGHVSLAAEDQQTLRLLWYMTLHLFSYLGSNENRLRSLFQGFVPAPRRGQRSPLDTCP